MQKSCTQDLRGFHRIGDGSLSLTTPKPRKSSLKHINYPRSHHRRLVCKIVGGFSVLYIHIDSVPIRKVDMSKYIPNSIAQDK
ncbi:hypothetical protein EB052_00420 [bacterium]|nr:hypothetical protein [bacterium]